MYDGPYSRYEHILRNTFQNKSIYEATSHGPFVCIYVQTVYSEFYKGEFGRFQVVDTHVSKSNYIAVTQASQKERLQCHTKINGVYNCLFWIYTTNSRRPSITFLGTDLNTPNIMSCLYVAAVSPLRIPYTNLYIMFNKSRR